MRKAFFCFISLVLFFFWINFANANLSPTITSVSSGWNWNSTGTWVGGIIPTTSDVVEIHWVVSTYSVTVAGLVVNNWATMQNHSNSNYTLTINWDVLNNGTIKNNSRNFYLSVSWSITNNWVWENYRTYLTWTGSKTISWNSLNSSVTFNSDMTILNSLVLEKWVNFNNKVITLSGTWNTITLSNSGSSLSLQWEIRWWNVVFVWTGTRYYYAYWNNFKAPKFIASSGSIVNFYRTTLNWDLEIESWAVVQSRNSSSYPTLQVNGNIVNSGTIKNNGSYSFSVTANWNITNNWIRENSNTYLSWTWSKSISWNSLKSSVTFNSDMTILNSLVLEKWVNFNNKVITLSGTWNTITLSNEGGFFRFILRD